MSSIPLRSGRITKVVRVGSEGEAPWAGGGSATNRGGYGLLKGQDGREAFFVDTDVEDALFCELRVGETVTYRIAPGPLARAASIRPVGRGAGSEIDSPDSGKTA
jgi:cold shock CspA family protein